MLLKSSLSNTHLVSFIFIWFLHKQFSISAAVLVSVSKTQRHLQGKKQTKLQFLPFSNSSQNSIRQFSPVVPNFIDVSEEVGLRRVLGRRRKKYGGPCIADLNGDGWVDLLFGHHDDHGTDLYYNNGDGTFTRNDWSIWNDTHSIMALRFSPFRKNMHFFLSVGGAYGKVLKIPAFLQINRDNSVENITVSSNWKNTNILNSFRGRGRSSVAMNLNLKNFQFPQIIILNAPLKQRVRNRVIKYSNQYFYDTFVNNTSGNIFLIKKNFLGNFASTLNAFGLVTDIDGDGIVELVTWHRLQIYKLIHSFNLLDITQEVIPSHLHGLHGIVAVCELDYNNDGHFDLYLGRTNTSDLKYLNREHPEQFPMHDILLENDGNGHYIDVTDEVIPQRFSTATSQTRGVTCGDFNNDGHIDILLSKFQERDVLLLNSEQYKFNAVAANYDAGVDKTVIYGDMVTAVDIDRDGKLDVVVSRGDYFDIRYGGYYHVMRNTQELSGQFLLVRVGNAPGLETTALHAVVTVFVSTSSNKEMKRRVGSPGTAVSNSNIEVVHFGVGATVIIDKVVVRWVDGSVQERENVYAGSLLIFGELPM